MGKVSSKKPATWWSVTAFNDEISKMETPPWPHFVRRVYGGVEICPKSGTRHFQGAVQCWTQVRMSQFKDWLPTAHLEPARQKEALMKYAMKAETSEGEKKVQENTIPHFTADVICTMIAQAILSGKNQTDNQTDMFWVGVKILLAETPGLAGQLMNPSLRNFYRNTESVWMSKAHTIVLQCGALSAIVPEGSYCGECGKDECEECFVREQNLSIEYTDEPEMEEASDEEEGSPETPC